MIRILSLSIGLPVAVLFSILAMTRPPPRAEFVVASDELRTIDPHRVSWMDEIQVAAALFEGLTRLDPLSLQPVPAVAERWDVAPDATTFTFHLRSAARWSNGDPVVAADFRAGWLRALDPRLGAQYATLLFVLNGGEAYYRSRLNAEPGDDAPPDTVGIEIVDPQTLRVRLSGPCAYFPDLAAFPTFAPIHAETLRRAADEEARGQRSGTAGGAWSRPEAIICNGPFELERWEFKRSLLLRRQPYYWDGDATNLRTIEVVMVGDPNAALIAYETGRIDLVSDLDTPVARGLLAATASGKRADFHVGERFSTCFFRVNCRRPPLDNADLRRALALAIDRDGLCRDVLGLGETPAYAFVPPVAVPLMQRLGTDGATVLYEPASGLGAELSPDERLRLARELLVRSGYDRQTASRPLELRYATNAPVQQRLCEAIESQWERNLGIRVELRAEERTVLGGRIRNLDYDIVRSDWFGDYMDPGAFLDLFTSESGQNRTGWRNADYDALIAAAAREPDADRRFAHYAAAEQILCTEELPIIPLFYKTGNHLLRPSFGGVGSNVRDIVPIHRVRRVDAATASGVN